MNTINGIIATPQIVQTYTEAKTLQLQQKTIVDLITVHTTQIKTYMDTKEILFNTDGAKLVTYEYTKPGQKVDTEYLKNKYPDIYNECLIPTDPIRRFLLK